MTDIAIENTTAHRQDITQKTPAEVGSRIKTALAQGEAVVCYAEAGRLWLCVLPGDSVQAS